MLQDRRFAELRNEKRASFITPVDRQYADPLLNGLRYLA